MSPNRLKHREAFGKVGRVISKLKTGDPNSPDYQTGRESEFEIKGKPVQDRELSSRLYGPQFSTQQWERTLKK